MSTKIYQNVPQKFNCIICEYITSRKSQYERHLLTAKHLKSTNVDKSSKKSSEIPTNTFLCECGRVYKERTGLWRHKKKCIFENYVKPKTNDDKQKEDINAILEIVKQNQEFKDLILEQSKQMIEQHNKIIELSEKINVTNVTNTTNNNKTKFNMNFFLNEKCKDAVNLMDFVNDLQIQLTDLENVGRLGYTEGISKIFINGLKQLDVSKRPIHCSDIKREVLYVKDQDAWEKENEENKKIKKAIHHISSKNIKQIQKWTECHPHCKESDSKQNDQYLQILCESMGSSEPSNLDKVIRNIAKEVIIDK